jgi:hypothetical protein
LNKNAALLNTVAAFAVLEVGNPHAADLLSRM